MEHTKAFDVHILNSLLSVLLLHAELDVPSSDSVSDDVTFLLYVSPQSFAWTNLH